jgi:hypothetical protein
MTAAEKRSAAGTGPKTNAVATAAGRERADGPPSQPQPASGKSAEAKRA